MNLPCMVSSAVQSFVHKILRSYDKGNTGRLTPEQLKQAMSRLRTGLSPEEQDQVISRLDGAGTGQVCPGAMLGRGRSRADIFGGFALVYGFARRNEMQLEQGS